MNKKPDEIEADLDPAGTRHSRPGGKAAESALANAKPAAKSKRRKTASEPTRPGSTAASRAVDATKRKR
jgi:hypothetical protein